MRQRLLLLSIICMPPAVVFYTFSRGGLIGLASTLGIVGMRANNAARLGLFLAFVAVLAMYPLYADQWTREEGFSELGGDYTFMGRIFSIEIGTLMFLDNPITGVGLGASALGMWEYVGWYEFYMAIHNTYAQVFAEVGLFGALAYLGALAVSLVGADRVTRESKKSGDLEMMYYAVALEASILGFMICAMAGPYLNSWAPLLLIALASSLRRIDRAEKLSGTAAPSASMAPVA
jgi:O-antigen ligase